MYYSKLLKKQYYLNKIDIIFMNYFIDEKISYNMINKNENSNTNTIATIIDNNDAMKWVELINIILLIY